LFLDETLHNCQPILTELNNASIRFERHGAHFEAGVPDVKWLPEIGRLGWALLTCDRRLRYNELEIAKIIEYRIKAFFFTSGNLSGLMMAEILSIALPKMKRLSKKVQPPFIATLSESGNVAVRYNREGSIHSQRRRSTEHEQ
jgi:PIN like domain